MNTVDSLVRKYHSTVDEHINSNSSMNTVDSLKIKITQPLKSQNGQQLSIERFLVRMN